MSFSRVLLVQFDFFYPIVLPPRAGNQAAAKEVRVVEQGIQLGAGWQGGLGEGGPVAPAAAEERVRGGRGLLHAQGESGAEAGYQGLNF